MKLMVVLGHVRSRGASGNTTVLYTVDRGSIPRGSFRPKFGVVCQYHGVN